LLERLSDLLQGKHRIDKVIDDDGDPTDPAGKINVRARMDFAKSLISDKKFDQATGECLWLWEHMSEHDDYLEFERLCFLPMIMVRLAEQYEPAQVAFTKLRDAARKEMDAGSEIRDVILDWFTLCEILGDKNGILAWFDQVKDDMDYSDVISTMAYKLFDLLVEQLRWADAGLLEKDPVGAAKMRVDMDKVTSEMNKTHVQFDAQTKAMFAKMHKERLLKDFAQHYACCLAAELDEEAIEIANIFLDYRDNPDARIALVQWAMKMNQPRKEQLLWLDEAAENGRYVKALRQKVQDALAK
jgi:hypothetical protein